MDQDPIRILIVDDNEVVRLGIRANLEAIGLLCQEAENGLQALSLIKTRTVDVLLTDFNMPYMDGLQLTQTVSQNAASYGSPTIIFMSAGISDKTRSMAYQAGADTILDKPFSISEVLMAIQNHFDHLPQAA